MSWSRKSPELWQYIPVLLHRVCYGNDGPPNIETTKMSRKKSILYPLSGKSILFTVRKHNSFYSNE